MSLQRTTQWVVLTCLSLAALSVQAFNMRGFRGVSWGEASETIGEARVTYTAGAVTCFQRERENLLFGDVALIAVRYCFHKDRLFMVRLAAAVSATALAAEFERSYGPPDVRRAHGATWGTQASGARADLFARAETATLVIYSNKIEPAVAQSMKKLAAMGECDHPIRWTADRV